MLEAQQSVPLKLPELDINSDDPWMDDLLSRDDIAKRLTNLVSTQEPPLAISLHGQWGTGKTFLLMRWQKDLQQQGFKAIYFNAWDDDFCEDPLLAILGQMAETFKEDKFKSLTQQVAKTAMSLLKRNVISVLENKTGISLETEQAEPNILDEYLKQRTTKDELRGNLAKLSKEIYKDTEHPLVFIIDELDRCRPTFAIELLERVKHIFDVHNMVFIIGINRDQLCKSLSTVYGNINTDIYLRRFFDFEFNLPEADSQVFAEHLIDRFQLNEAFQSLSETSHNSVHNNDYDNYRRVLPKLSSALGLSLRDIDYSIRLLALLTRNVPLQTYTCPHLVVILIAMKFKSPEFYSSLISGDFLTREIIDYMCEEFRAYLIDDTLIQMIDRSEGFLYCSDRNNRRDQSSGEQAMTELEKDSSFSAGLSHSFLSRRAQNADSEQRRRIIRAIIDGRKLGIDRGMFQRLAALIDTYQTQLRR